MLINQCTKYIYLKIEKSIKRSFEKGILCAANLKNANSTIECKEPSQVPSIQKKQKKELGRIEAFKEIMTNITVPEMVEA